MHQKCQVRNIFTISLKHRISTHVRFCIDGVYKLKKELIKDRHQWYTETLYSLYITDKFNVLFYTLVVTGELWHFLSLSYKVRKRHRLGNNAACRHFTPPVHLIPSPQQTLLMEQALSLAVIRHHSLCRARISFSGFFSTSCPRKPCWQNLSVQPGLDNF